MKIFFRNLICQVIQSASQLLNNIMVFHVVMNKMHYFLIHPLCKFPLVCLDKKLFHQNVVRKQYPSNNTSFINCCYQINVFIFFMYKAKLVLSLEKSFTQYFYLDFFILSFLFSNFVCPNML